MTELAARGRLSPGAAAVRRPLLLAGGLGLMTLALRFRDPHQHASWGLCPFKLLTGWDCPGCGGLRAVNDLTHGHLAAAAASNLFFVVSIPLLVGLWFGWVRGAWTGRPSRVHPRLAKGLVTGYLGLLVLFTIYRNTPWGHALHVS